MKVHLSVDHGMIREATYETYQCPGCVACGKAICEMVTGVSVEIARAVKHPALVERVGPLPKHRQICYGLTLLALSDALGQLSQDDR
jgi:NifU-like protein involved in Fe-S cluster formation